MSDKDKVRVVGYIAMGAVAVTLALTGHPVIAFFVLCIGFDEL